MIIKSTPVPEILGVTWYLEKQPAFHKFVDGNFLCISKWWIVLHSSHFLRKILNYVFRFKTRYITIKNTFQQSSGFVALILKFCNWMRLISKQSLLFLLCTAIFSQIYVVFLLLSRSFSFSDDCFTQTGNKLVACVNFVDCTITLEISF